MSSQSILETEEARRRLHEIERDHAEILELVARLRQICRTAESRTRDLEDQTEDARSLVGRCRILLARLESGMTAFEAEKQSLLDRIEKTSQGVTEALEELQRGLVQRQEEGDFRQHSALSEMRALVNRRNMLVGAMAVASLLLSTFATLRCVSTRTAAGEEQFGREANANTETTRHESTSVLPPSASPPTATDESAELPRVWTDVHGRTVAATFVGFRDGMICLRKLDDGQIYPVPLGGLSPADQVFLQGREAVRQARVHGFTRKTTDRANPR